MKRGNRSAASEALHAAAQSVCFCARVQVVLCLVFRQELLKCQPSVPGLRTAMVRFESNALPTKSNSSKVYKV